MAMGSCACEGNGAGGCARTEGSEVECGSVVAGRNEGDADRDRGRTGGDGSGA